MRTWWIRIFLLAFVAASLPGCGGADATPVTSDHSEKPVVVATTTMIADLATVLAGDDARVVSIMRPGEDPHIYRVQPRDAQIIATADLILMNGLHLEATLGQVVDHNASGQVHRLAESPGVTVLGTAPDGSDAGAGGGAPDPHAWMSVPNFKAYTLAARDALIQIDPDHADAYRRRAQTYLQELDTLDAWIRQQFATVPESGRVIVTSHDAFAYFGHAYGVEVHAIIGISTEQQPRPQDIQALEALVRERGVKALFIETSVSEALNQLVRKVAHAADARIGGTLYSDSLGPQGSNADTYLNMMKANTQTITQALQ